MRAVIYMCIVLYALFRCLPHELTAPERPRKLRQLGEDNGSRLDSMRQPIAGILAPTFVQALHIGDATRFILPWGW